MTDIFVFGSNLAGRHGAGSALEALKKHGAIYGQGVGRQGNSYAIPTNDERLRTMSIGEIRRYVWLFDDYARLNPDFRFNVVAIGCGLAGYEPEDIAPLFASAPSNVILPPEFTEVFDRAGCPRPTAA